MSVVKNDALNLLAEERERQISEEGFTQDGDLAYRREELAAAAAAYALPPRHRWRNVPPDWWPFSVQWWKPGNPDDNKERIKELVKAGALIVAQIEVLQNQKPIKQQQSKVKGDYD